MTRSRAIKHRSPERAEGTLCSMTKVSRNVNMADGEHHLKSRGAFAAHGTGSLPCAHLLGG